VHPPDWTNPEPKARYHLVVVGAGTGGLVTAAAAAGLGAAWRSSSGRSWAATA
jgi:NADPH-dependent 2,4-dienoyl-CoA reductase/sulfur reductase-like enzyme